MTDTCNPDRLAQTIAALPGGVLSAGCHGPDTDECCILEAVALCEGLRKTDRPLRLNRPDVRPLNDAEWSTPQVRTEQMLRLAPLLAAWPLWDETQRRDYLTRVALRNMRETLASMAPTEEIAQLCRDANTYEKAITALGMLRSVALPYYQEQASRVIREGLLRCEGGSIHDASSYLAGIATATSKPGDEFLTVIVDAWVIEAKSEST